MPQPPQRPPSSTYTFSASASPEIMAPSAQISDTSPSFSPRTCVPSILPSPALGPTNPQNLQGIDHEATAALLMLTRDRRGTADSISEHFLSGTALAGPLDESRAEPDTKRRKGMSVRDLLIS